jgi:putative cardiolipin synthase
LILISPYYVPGKNGVQLIRDLKARGVRTIIATNSLASNNHVPVHSAYAHYRKDIIRAGAELYEARADAARGNSSSETGPDALTLHTKLYLIDRRYLFVGSLNLDPRSIVINAEMGLLIDSPEMAGAIAERIEQRLSDIAYRVVLNERGKLEWHATIDGAQAVETREPQTSRWLRFKAWVLKIVPESQL